MNTNERNADWKRAGERQLFQDAEIAAKNRDLAALTVAFRQLTSFHTMLEQFKNHVAPPTKQPNEPLAANPKSTPSDKERGERVRTDWVAKHFASTLAPLRGAVYRTTSGENLGIAYGEEKEGRQGRWFLGLPSGKFDSAVLLCQPRAGELFWFTLPKEFIRKHTSYFSKSKVGQTKFSVFRRGDTYSLQIPHVGRVPISEYFNKYI